MRRMCGACSAALLVAGLIAAPAGAHGGGHAVRISVLLEPRRPGQRRRRAGARPCAARACAQAPHPAQRRGRDRSVRAARRRARGCRGRAAPRRQRAHRRPPVARAGAAARHELPDHRADLLRAAADADRLQDQPAAAAAERLAGRADRRQPGGRRVPRARLRRRHRGLEPRLQRAHGRRLPVPHDRRRVEGAARRRRPPRRHGHHDDARRPHGRLRRAPRARHDRPLPLLLRHARAAGRLGHRHVAVERPARLRVRRRRGDRPQPGHARQRLGRPRPARPGLRDRALQRQPHRASTTTSCSAARPR